MTAVEQEDALADAPLLTVVPDANVLIHGRSLVDLPWAELGRAQIEVVFVPPMIRELDKLKTQTGRQNKIARQLSSEIRTLITASGRQAEVRAAGPKVVKRVELQPVTDAVSPTLRLEHADQTLINYALWLRQAGADVLLLTDDTICGTTAQEVGLPVHFLPEHWLRPPEPDESAKDNARLRAEVQRLSSAEPIIELSFRDEAGAAVPNWKPDCCGGRHWKTTKSLPSWPRSSVCAHLPPRSSGQSPVHRTPSSVVWRRSSACLSFPLSPPARLMSRPQRRRSSSIGRPTIRAGYARCMKR